MRASQFRICAAMALLVATVAFTGHADPGPSRFRGYRPAPSNSHPLRVSVGDAFGKTSHDSCAIYGGPGSLDGKFEDSAGNPDWQGWTSFDLTEGVLATPVGDFAKLFDDLSEIDPCRSNDTPQLTFLDDGSDPNNLPGQSTGGETSSNWSYGSGGGWVVNFSGGASFGSGALHNEVWSPVILWDDPVSTCEDLLEGGCVLKYNVWDHLPLANGMFHFWSVRSYSPAVGWSEWVDRDYLYFSETPTYQRRELQIADLLQPNTTRLQIALGVVDLADVFGLPGTDATPSPFFDDVSVWRHDVSGPLLSAREEELFQDSFPHSAAGYNASNLPNSVMRMDAAFDLGLGSTGPVFGDSMVVRVVPTRPGAELVGPPQMAWLMRTNTLFNAVRTMPSGSIQHSPTFWSGSVSGYLAVDASGTVPDSNLWAFDLPDGPPRLGVSEPTEPSMFFPGDLLVWGVMAEDSFGGSNWLAAPPDSNVILASELCGSGKKPQSAPQEPEPDDPNSLPGIWEGPQKLGEIIPRVLVWDDSGDPDEPIIVGRALLENGLLPGRDYDFFHTNAPSSAVGNGLGGRAGSAEHLRDYDILIYLGGEAPAPLISDGSGNAPNDRSDDIGILDGWRLQEFDRHAFYFADNMASAMEQQGLVASLHAQSVLGISLLDSDFSDDVGLLAPSVIPVHTAAFATSYVANSGCEPKRRFDAIVPASGSAAIVGHRFADLGGTPITTLAASVWHDRFEVVGASTVRRLDVTFPYGLSRIEDEREPAPGAITKRALLMGELLTAAGFPVVQTGTVDVPPVVGDFAVGQPWPNPFNPQVVISFENPRPQRVSAKVFDLRGRHVESLFDGIAAAGSGVFRWDGTDRGGVRVASGVYLVMIATESERWSRKVVLVE